MKATKLFCSLLLVAAVATCFTACNRYEGHDYVDLGLSVKWATCNVGAISPEECGNYYAWGETAAKSDYTWSTYAHGNLDYDALVKYNTVPDYSENAEVKNTLELSDDAAHVNWGGNWRMPTDAEWNELKEKCTWEWKIVNGVKGYEVIGKNGNSIFIPAAGIRYDSETYDVNGLGYYWSSSYDVANPGSAWYVDFGSKEAVSDYDDYYFGRTVRPVF